MVVVQQEAEDPAVRERHGEVLHLHTETHVSAPLGFIRQESQINETHTKFSLKRFNLDCLQASHSYFASLQLLFLFSKNVSCSCLHLVTWFMHTMLAGRKTILSHAIRSGSAAAVKRLLTKPGDVGVNLLIQCSAPEQREK